MNKRFAEINGEMWEAAYPFCAGCPELAIQGVCCYEGNGCRYPDSRMEHPKSFRNAFFIAVKESGMGHTEYSRHLSEVQNETAE